MGAVNDAAGFYVRVHDSPNIMQRLHQTDDATNTDSCTVLSTDATKDITCVVDVPEEDLYFHGISFQYNVPTDMCTYLHFDPYYFENFPIGEVASSEPTRNIAATFNVYTKSGLTGYAPDMAGNSPDPMATPPAGLRATFTDGGLPICKFDFSQGDPKGPNCCLGTSAYTLYTRKSDDTGWDVSQVKSKWNGKASDCLAGPAIDNKHFSTSGFPITEISYIQGTGLNKAFTVRAPMMAWGLYDTTFAANFAKPMTSVPNGIDGFVLNDGRRTSFQPFQWSCLDRNSDVIARIKLYVREWNQYSEWLAMGDPDTTGFEDAPFDHDPKNDMADWNDLDSDTLGYPRIVGITAPTAAPKSMESLSQEIAPAVAHAQLSPLR